jgi:hypothetical protein
MDLRWSLWQNSLNIPWGTKPTSGVVGLTVLQPKFLEQFPNARFHFNGGDGAQRGTFKGVWLNNRVGAGEGAAVKIRPACAWRLV